MKGFLNTRYNGEVRIVIFEDEGQWFGAALEFNIVETGDSAEEAELLIDLAVQGYIDAARKSKLSMHVLNQEIDPDYEAKWSDPEDERVYKTSRQKLPAFA